MKREELRKLGLNKQEVDSIMALHGRAVGKLLKKIKAVQTEEGHFINQSANEHFERKRLEASIVNIRDSAGVFADAQMSFTQAQKDLKCKFSEFQKSIAVEFALIQAGAKNTNAIKALLDWESLELAGDDVVGLEEQLMKIKTENSYLFQLNQGKDGSLSKPITF